MGDPRKCCILGICCPILRQTQVLVDFLVADGMDELDAQKAAECLAPKIRNAAKASGVKFTAEAEENGSEEL